MIELRWLQKHSKVERTNDDGIPWRESSGVIGICVRVLQFRNQVHADAAKVYEDGKAYTEWQDVPTVDAPLPQGER